LGMISSQSLTDHELITGSVYIGIAGTYISMPYLDIGGGIVYYSPLGMPIEYGQNHMAAMLSEIMGGDNTLFPREKINSSVLNFIRAGAVYVSAPKYIYVYEEMRNEHESHKKEE
jgi:hypothetical protein